MKAGPGCRKNQPVPDCHRWSWRPCRKSRRSRCRVIGGAAGRCLRRCAYCHKRRSRGSFRSGSISGILCFGGSCSGSFCGGRGSLCGSCGSFGSGLLGGSCGLGDRLGLGDGIHSAVLNDLLLFLTAGEQHNCRKCCRDYRSACLSHLKFSLSVSEMGY